MIHPETETHSEWEGEPLPFLSPLFALLPGGNNFWPVRIVYEPLTLGIGAAVLNLLHVLDGNATTYLLVAAALLSVKCSMEWYRAWLYVRILLDGQAAAPIIAAAMKGTASDADMARVHLAGFSKALPPQVRAAAIAQRAGGLPQHLASLLSPLDKPEAA
jgi:hypothetical protein